MSVFRSARSLFQEDGDAPLVRAAVGDTIRADTTTTSSLAIGGAAKTSAIDFAGDKDWFRVTLVAGQSYQFTLNASGSSALSDPFLEVHDDSGRLIAVDDDGGIGPGTDSMMRYTALSSGTYYIAAGGFEDALGTYTISAALGPPQDPLDTLDLGFKFYTSNIKVYFALEGETFGPGNTSEQTWSASEKAAVMSALGKFSDIANLSFTQTSSAGSADFIFTLTSLEAGVLGQTFPGVSKAYLEFTPLFAGFSTEGLMPGGAGYAVILHEVGHALGLDHPHMDGQDEQVMQGVIDLFDSYGDFDLNQSIYTIMSYNDGWPGNAQPAELGAGNAAGPMALDIAFLQRLYGANMSFNLGDTTYALSDSGKTYVAIWDAGGIDSITYAGASSVSIDLRDATLLNARDGGGVVSYTNGGRNGGFTIAHGTVIENASGGAGDDEITGNSANNTLYGNAGFDTLYGLDGNDTLNGGTGNGDFLYGGAGADILTSDATSALLDGGAGADTMYGGDAFTEYYVDNVDDVIVETGDDNSIHGYSDTVRVSNIAVYTAPTHIEHVSAHAGVTTLIGNALDNSLTFMAESGLGPHRLDGGAGADVMQGAGGMDTYVVDNAGDQIIDPGGYSIVETYLADSFFAAVNEYRLMGDNARDAHGDADAETFFGNELSNRFEGFGGADVLNGASGADMLIGGAGDDLYYVETFGDTAVEDVDAGYDTVIAARSWAVASNFEKVVLDGTGDFNVAGNGLANVLRGNGGDNWLNGSFGKDILTGGKGRDSFIFNRALGPNNVDVITDFDVPRDTIRIDNAIFTGIGAAGVFTANQFWIGTAAHDGDDHIIYDSATGKLFYDADGTGAAAQVHFATLSTGLAMTSLDFIVI